MEDLEQTYTNSPFVPVSYGDVRRTVDANRFHLRSVVLIVQALHPTLLLKDEALDELTTKLEVELPVAALPLLAVPSLTRGEILLLVRQAITQPAVAWAMVEPVATKLFGAARAQQLATVCPPLPARGVS
jgi:helicase